MSELYEIYKNLVTIEKSLSSYIDDCGNKVPDRLENALYFLRLAAEEIGNMEASAISADEEGAEARTKSPESHLSNVSDHTPVNDTGAVTGETDEAAAPAVSSDRTAGSADDLESMEGSILDDEERPPENKLDHVLPLEDEKEIMKLAGNSGRSPESKPDDAKAEEKEEEYTIDWGRKDHPSRKKRWKFLYH